MTFLIEEIQTLNQGKNAIDNIDTAARNSPDEKIVQDVNPVINVSSDILPCTSDSSTGGSKVAGSVVVRNTTGEDLPSRTKRGGKL